MAWDKMGRLSYIGVAKTPSGGISQFLMKPFSVGERANPNG